MLVVSMMPWVGSWLSVVMRSGAPWHGVMAALAVPYAWCLSGTLLPIALAAACALHGPCVQWPFSE
jgi:hypothetical protein